MVQEEIALVKFCCNAAIAVSSFVFMVDGRDPVSYTHLDVYKRQGLDGEGNSDTVMEHIRKIRAKLAACTLHSYIDTVWGLSLIHI